MEPAARSLDIAEVPRQTPSSMLVASGSAAEGALSPGSASSALGLEAASVGSSASRSGLSSLTALGGLSLATLTPPGKLTPRSRTPPANGLAATGKVSESAIMAIVKNQLSSLEEKLSSQILRVQQQGDRWRDAAFSRVDSKMGAVESLQPKYDRRMAELSGNVRGLSDEMQSQLRRIDQMDSRLWEWRHQLEEELRSRLAEVEQALQQGSSAQRVAKATNEEALKKMSQRLLRVEGLVEEHHSHAEETTQGLMTLHSRIVDLEEFPSLQGLPHEELERAAVEQPTARSSLESEHTVAALDTRLTELNLEVRETLQKLEQLQRESHDTQARVGMQEEKTKSLSAKLDTKDEQYRAMMDKFQDANMEGRLKALHAKVQDLDAASTDVVEKLQILQQRVENQEQDANSAASALRQPSPRFNRSGATTPKLETSGDGPAASEEVTLAVNVMIAEVRQCQVRLEGVEKDLGGVGEQVQVLMADQGLGVHVSALVSQLKDLVPKVIGHDSDIKSLQKCVFGTSTTNAANHIDKEKGLRELSLGRQLTDRDDIAQQQEQQGIEDEVRNANLTAEARARIQLSRAAQGRASVAQPRAIAFHSVPERLTETY
eukprot:TRINITY_DN72128_c0_g1_i1.p1 TRINITY_DN72128_c0_g1~~TRINITY_DN72128_c0_g1_i1.p1  ORF type:complete len:604 (-),score=138.70 TRINITY_DN72128_c0_g1_i1:19-1830(-)